MSNDVMADVLRWLQDILLKKYPYSMTIHQLSHTYDLNFQGGDFMN